MTLLLQLRGSERRADGRQFVSFEVVDGHWRPEYREDFKVMWRAERLEGDKTND